MKVQNLSDKINPFSGISFVNKIFIQSGLNQLIDNELGIRVKKAGYNYSEIIRNLSNVFLSGGDHIEDLDTYMKEYLSEIPDNNVPGADTVLRALTELSTENSSFESGRLKSYDFNINDKLNKLNIRSLKTTGLLKPDNYCDFDYDNQILAHNKFDAKSTYKGNKGYFPGIATIGDKVVYIENRAGNANVKLFQEKTLKNAYELLLSEGIKINRSRMDAGSYSQKIIDVVAQYSRLFYIRANKSQSMFKQIKSIENWQEVEINYKKYQVASIKFEQFFQDRNYRLVIMREASGTKQLDLFTGDNFIYRSILTNDWESTEKEIIEYYNQRGASEKIFDEMNNDFGWAHLPFSFMHQNTAFMIIMSMIKNFYGYVKTVISKVFTEIKPTTRIKRFVFKFIVVAGKWKYQGRQWILKLFTNRPYKELSL